MKIKQVPTSAPAFEPITVQYTFESQVEYDAFKTMMCASGVIDSVRKVFSMGWDDFEPWKGLPSGSAKTVELCRALSDYHFPN